MAAPEFKEWCNGCEYNKNGECPVFPHEYERRVIKARNFCIRAVVKDETGEMTKEGFTPLDLVVKRMRIFRGSR